LALQELKACHIRWQLPKAEQQALNSQQQELSKTGAMMIEYIFNHRKRIHHFMTTLCWDLPIDTLPGRMQ